MRNKIIPKCSKLQGLFILYLYQIKIETQIYDKMEVEKLKNIEIERGKIPVQDFL